MEFTRMTAKNSMETNEICIVGTVRMCRSVLMCCWQLATFTFTSKCGLKSATKWYQNKGWTPRLSTHPSKSQDTTKDATKKPTVIICLFLTLWTPGYFYRGFHGRYEWHLVPALSDVKLPCSGGRVPNLRQIKQKTKNESRQQHY